jgi:hypothetical protein
MPSKFEEIYEEINGQGGIMSISKAIYITR